ncbi:MAG: GNAT family N-acetyltransferase [Proteobacteria bacterium]|nr:GNAT family N-acetyltransferase [Pseudomonadota bacterium]MBU1582178.1 GNAT family N-acetyltransferase [Pseudomonadota bacterium]MBU2454711.1 GNAT family N-acetyltransferase [Pseudomonadota bacterium]MBU2631981.1 GNAT family N-acetyltransferase [Pseudomonadota bacterium]
MSDDFSAQLVIKTIKSAPLAQLIPLYKEAGWWDPSYDQDPEFLNHIVKDSAFFVGVFFKKKLIGMGRALSDLASDAYIQDVAVLKEFRGKGIGKKIIQFLIEKLKENGVDWIGLIAEPGTYSFYKELGFEPLKDHVPLKYKGQ